MIEVPLVRPLVSRPLVSLLFLGALVLSGAIVPWGSARADWPVAVGGNSARNGQACSEGPAGSDLLWDGSLPAIVAQQACIENGIVAMARIESFTIPTGTWIVAHDLLDGQILWQTQLPMDFPDSWRSRVSGIRDGKVYGTRAGNTNDDYLYALDALTGAVLWQSDDLIDESTTESLAFTDDGDLIAGNFSSLLRIDDADGSTVWETPRSCPTSGGCQVALFGDRAYLWEASPGGPVISTFDLADGAFLYSSLPQGGGFIEQLGPFVGPDGTVYAPRSVNNPSLDFLAALEDTGTGFSEKWSVPIGYVPFASFGVGIDGSVYAYRTSSAGGQDFITVFRLDPDTGVEIDTSIDIPTDFPSQPRMAIDVTGIIFMTNGGFADGAVYSFEPDLSVRWSESIPNVNVGGPALAGSEPILVVCGVGTNVRAYGVPYPPGPQFIRGDCDGSLIVGLPDAFQGLGFLFQGGAPPPCDDACDFNDDGFLGLPDMIGLLSFLFSSGSEPPEPYPGCWVDPTDDGLPCPTTACP